MKYKDLTGLRLGKLTVLEPTEERSRGAVVWKCRCDCGNVITVESRRLKPGAVYSCRTSLIFSASRQAMASFPLSEG